MSYNNNPVVLVSDKMQYPRVNPTIQAVATTATFFTQGSNEFSYYTNSEAVIPLASTLDGAMADFRHASISMTVKNENNYPIFFDRLSTSIIRKMAIKQEGIEKETLDRFNCLVNLLLKHSSTNSFMNELKIMSGYTNAPLTDTGALNLSPSLEDNDVDFANNQIPPNSSVNVQIPILFTLLLAKLFPLFALSSPMYLHIWFEQPNRAFIGHDVSNAGNNSCNYSVSNIRLNTNIISIRDNAFISLIGNKSLDMSKDGGLFINGKTWNTLEHVIEGSNTNEIETKTITLNNKFGSLCQIFNAFYVNQSNINITNLNAGHFGLTGWQYNLGDIQIPKNAVKCGIDTKTKIRNYSEAYLNVQQCISNGGYYSTSNISCVDWSDFHRANPNSFIDFGSNLYTDFDTKAKPKTDGTAVERRNEIYPSSFCMATSFEKMNGMSGTELGLNTLILHNALTLTFTRSSSQCNDRYSYKNNNHETVYNFHDVSGLSTTEIPNLLMLSFISYDAQWRIQNGIITKFS